MGRMLFLVVVVFAIYWLLKSYRKQLRKDEATGDVPGAAEDMVRCMHCGVHLPKHESLLVEGEYYCSEAHRRAHTERSD